MVLSFSRFAHYYRKVRAIGIVRSIRTLEHTINARINKGDPKRSLLFNYGNFKIPDQLPFSYPDDNNLLEHANDILVTESTDWYDINRDIRLVWEPARFTQSTILASAYKKTSDQRYLDRYRSEIKRFLIAQQKLSHIYNYNAMEVALRAINWTISIVILRDTIKEDQSFFEQIIQQLYEDMHFIEKNWEWYDGRTSNHYLANIVGYAYLSWFFQERKKLDWCTRELEKEFAWQIFDEGTSYEGSTRYHLFITELFLHGFLITKSDFFRILRQAQDERKKNQTLPVRPEPVEGLIIAKLRRMLLFIEHCKPAYNSLPIMIGDDDSGRVLDSHLLSINNLAAQLDINTNWPLHEIAGLHEYANFGISLYRSDNWHISLRHHAYRARQLSGHFHHDQGSITIAYKGQPLIIDPGSYIYTADPAWRNFFRSAEQHSTIFALDNKANEPDLFGLELAQKSYTKMGCLRTIFNAGQAMVTRELSISDDTVIITDTLSSLKKTRLAANFIFAPGVKVEKDHDAWRIIMPDGAILLFQSNLTFEALDGWYAPSYGTKLKTMVLRAHFEVENRYEVSTTLRPHDRALSIIRRPY